MPLVCIPFSFRPVYVSTVRPQSKHIVVIVDHGASVTETQLQIAKDAAQVILSSIDEHDKVSLLYTVTIFSLVFLELCLISSAKAVFFCLWSVTRGDLWSTSNEWRRLELVLEACVTMAEAFGHLEAEKSENHWSKGKSCFCVILKCSFVLAQTLGTGQQCDAVWN